MKQWHLARIGCAIALSWQAAVMGQPRVLEPGRRVAARWCCRRHAPRRQQRADRSPRWLDHRRQRPPPAHAQALLERIRASGKPLRTIINTQWQLDHTGGNATLRDAFPSLRVMAGDADLATPDVVVRERATVELAGLGLGIGVERGAITASDVWVYESSSQVLVAGDLVTLPVPLFTTACPERLGRCPRAPVDDPVSLAGARSRRAPRPRAVRDLPRVVSSACCAVRPPRHRRINASTAGCVTPVACSPATSNRWRARCCRAASTRSCVRRAMPSASLDAVCVANAPKPIIVRRRSRRNLNRHG